MAEADWGEPPAYDGISTKQSGHTDWHEEQAAGPPPDARPGAAPTQGSGMMNIFAAGLSLVLLGGMGVWGYKLAVRDVTGVPVVRALEGPMRIQPDDPGGEEAAYQGYSVNAVQGLGGAEAPAQTLALAPRNTGLAPEDLPAGATTSISAAPMPVAEAAPTPRPAPAEDSEAAMQVLADQLSAGVEPLSDVVQTSASGTEATLRAADQAVAEVVNGPRIIAASVPGVARSPRPVGRPAGLDIRVPAAVPVAAPVDTGVELAAAEIPVGTQMVQLGAFDSPQIARSEWDRLSKRFEDYFGGKNRVVMQATSGGRQFWRLRATGFDDLPDARRFCAVLATARAPCIPVVTR